MMYQQQCGAPGRRSLPAAAAPTHPVPLPIFSPSLPSFCSVRPGSPARSNSVQVKLGRASSSKKWLLIAAAATAATIALAVGLGVGLSQNSSSSSSSSSGDASASGGDGQQPDTGTPAQLYNAPGDQRVPPEACMALARGTAPGSEWKGTAGET